MRVSLSGSKRPPEVGSFADPVFKSILTQHVAVPNPRIHLLNILYTDLHTYRRVHTLSRPY